MAQKKSTKTTSRKKAPAKKSTKKASPEVAAAKATVEAVKDSLSRVG